MKYIFAFLFLSLLLISCGKEEEKPAVTDKNQYTFDTSDIKTSPVDNPNQTFLVRYKFEKGKDYKYRLTTITNNVQSVESKDTTVEQTVLQNIIYLMTIKGIEVDSDSTMELSITISSVKLDADASGEKFSYQSGVTKDSAELVRYSEYEAFAGNPFSLRISKYGEIIEIFRVDKILNKFLELRKLSDSLSASEKDLMKRDITEGAIKPLLQQIVRKFPENRIAKDSSWSLQQPASQFAVFQLQNTNIYEVSSLEQLDGDEIAVIEGSLKTNITGDPKFNERGIQYDFQKPKTSASGKIFFNISEGLIQKSKTATHVEMSFTLEGSTPQGIHKELRKSRIENINVLELL